MKRRNICITINSLNMGGAEKQCLLLARALRPYHNTVVAILSSRPAHGPLSAFLQTHDIDHEYLPENFIRKMTGLVALFKKNDTEIIFSFLPTDTLLSAVCGKMARVPHIFGGLRNSAIARLKFAALRAAHNYLLDYTIANNFAVYRTARASGFEDRIFVISNGIDLRASTPQKEPVNQKITIISLGRLVQQKEYATALKCIAYLTEQLGTAYELQYQIVGHGPEEQRIRTTIKSLGLENSVQIHTDAPQVYKLLKRADIYLCTSSFEGISNAIMEAMNCALPIVATDAGDNRRLVLHQKNGFIADIDDYRAMAAHLKSLIESPSERLRMGGESYAHLAENFSFSTFQSNYLNLIEQVEQLTMANGTLNVDLQNLKPRNETYITGKP